MRKLVTIRTVSAVDPIEGADAIECLTVEGWKVVSQKGNFKPGDPCVYFEIDSFLPDGNPLWQDLVDKSSRMFDGKKGHVLRTIKLRGQVSQGFCIPLRKFPTIIEKLNLRIAWESKIKDEFEQNHALNFDAEIAIKITAMLRESLDMKIVREIDWSEHLGVVKYEAPIPAELAGEVKGVFPSFIRKTDQERCQNLANEIFADLDARYEVTVKLDGSSCTVYHDPEEVGGVCSRNLEMKNNEVNASNSFVRVARDTKLLEFMKEVFPDYAIQGELMGPGVQGNREQLKRHELFIFDIFDIKKGQHVDPTTRAAMFDLMVQRGVEVNHVPVLHEDVSLRELGLNSVEDLLAFAEGKSLKHDVREGVVFKRLDGQFSFKAISNKFLLKQKE